MVTKKSYFGATTDLRVQGAYPTRALNSITAEASEVHVVDADKERIMTRDANGRLMEGSSKMQRSILRWLGLTSSMFLLFGGPALAQEAEETVWFILFGFDNEVQQNSALSRIFVHRLNNNRWSIKSESALGNFHNEVEIYAMPDGSPHSGTQNNKCLFTVNIFDDNGIMQQYDVFNFSNVTDFNVKSDFTPGYLGQGVEVKTIDISGNSLYVQYVKDANSNFISSNENTWHRFGFAASPQRLNVAYNYFKNTFCKGAAF